MECLRILFALGILQAHGLIGQFDAELPCQLFHQRLLREDVPHGHQVVLVVVAHLQVLRTNAWRTHHHIHAVAHGLLCQWEIEDREKGLQSFLAET